MSSCQHNCPEGAVLMGLQLNTSLAVSRVAHALAWLHHLIMSLYNFHISLIMSKNTDVSQSSELLFWERESPGLCEREMCGNLQPFPNSLPVTLVSCSPPATLVGSDVLMNYTAQHSSVDMGLLFLFLCDTRARSARVGHTCISYH